MRPSRATLSLVFVLSLTALVITMLLMSLGYTQSARTAPLVIGLPTALFLIVQLGRDVRAMVKGDRIGGVASEQEADRYGDDGVLKDVASSRAETAVDEEPPTATAMTATLWVVGLALLIWVIGMMAAIPVFMIGFMRVFGQERWRTCIAFALGTAISVHLFFVQLLEIRLYRGLLGDLLPFL